MGGHAQTSTFPEILSLSLSHTIHFSSTMAPTRLDLLPTEIIVKIYRHLMDDVIHHMDQYVSYIILEGKIWPLGREWVMTWDNKPLDNRDMGCFGNRYAARLGCGCWCDSEDGFLTYYCGCGFAEEGATFAGSVGLFSGAFYGEVMVWNSIMTPPRVMYV